MGDEVVKYAQSITSRHEVVCEMILLGYSTLVRAKLPMHNTKDRLGNLVALIGFAGGLSTLHRKPQQPKAGDWVSERLGSGGVSTAAELAPTSGPIAMY